MNLPAIRQPTIRQTVIACLATLAAFGAAASFSHIYSFARAAGQPAAIAVLYPGSTDVLVACATACWLHASQHKLNAAFPRWAIAVGVAATVAANIGDHFRPIPFPVGAVVSGWPAVSFVLAVMLGHWFWNSGTVTEASRRHPVDNPVDNPVDTRRQPVDTRRQGAQEHAGAGATEASRDARNVTTGSASNGAGATSKTDLVRAELEAAQAEGKNPTAAELVVSLLEQGHKVSPTLARNIVRDSKVASNGGAA